VMNSRPLNTLADECIRCICHECLQLALKDRAQSRLVSGIAFELKTEETMCGMMAEDQ